MCVVVLFTMFSVCCGIIYSVQCVLWYYLLCSVCVIVLFTEFTIILNTIKKYIYIAYICGEYNIYLFKV